MASYFYDYAEPEGYGCAFTVDADIDNESTLSAITGNKNTNVLLL